MITQAEVRKSFDYREDGNLIWKSVSKYHSEKLGKVAGYLRSDGYRHICINGKFYLSHQLVFLYHKGYIPEEIDHINRNTSDSRIKNLRECSRSQNQMNAGKYKSMNGNKCSSRYMGVCWKKREKKWLAQIAKDGKRYYLGYFHSELNAARAYDRKAIDLFGEFAKTNF